MTALDRRAQTRRVTGIAGVAVAVLFAAGNALWVFEQPDAGASTSEVVAFYADNSGRIIAGGSLSLIAIAGFILFASGVRAMLRDAEGDDLLADAAFGGGLILVATGLGAETINMVGALRADDGRLTPDLAQALFEISYVLGYGAAGVGVGVLVLATAAVALRTGALLPRWLALVAVPFGLAFFTPLAPFVLGPAVVLLAVLSAGLLRSRAPADRQSAAGG